MKTLVKMLLVLCATALCLTSDSATSVTQVQGSRFKVQGSEDRVALIQRLVRLRRHYPDSKILGLSELGPHCVHPSEAMNALRRELSDWP